MGHSAATREILMKQNRYVGDIGDYLKLGILRALSPGYRLGVAWWLFPDEVHNGDGRHIGYLNRPEQWRHFDPDLFDILVGVVSSGQRNVRALEASNILPGAIFADAVIPSGLGGCFRSTVRRCTPPNGSSGCRAAGERPRVR